VLTLVATPRLLAGRYRLDGKLGQGGMGKVYPATDMSLNREVAAFARMSVPKVWRLADNLV